MSEPDHGSAMTLLWLGILLIVFGLAWIPLARRREPVRSFLFPPWQRWSTYGAGAIVVSVGALTWGLMLVILWLIVRT